MLMTFMIMMMMLMIFMIMMMMLMTFMIMMMMLMIFMIMMMITKIIMITMRSKRKKGGVGEGSFFLTDLSISNRKQLKLDQRTAHICRFLVKVTRISVSRCTRLK